MRVDIAILGGGFSGTMVAANLLRRASGPLTVAVVERREALGRGVAYSTTESCHLLNVPAGAMSAWPDEPGHFLDWL
ncbi:MAG: FAD/NAD(P)-binding protein, partial [Candidatus Sericytochromatia bacterium]